MRERFTPPAGRSVSAPVVARAPGRVNLIGEHTDYNEGFVLPIAIDLGVEVGVTPSDDETVVLQSVAFGDIARVGPKDDPPRVEPAWARYVAAVLGRLRAHGLPVVGFRGTIRSDLPVGGGLSSSAALTTATALAAVEAARIEGAGIPPWLEDPKRLAAICRDAERIATGVRCGIMDPFVALHARRGQALFLDCRDLSHRFVPLDGTKVAVVVANTGVKRALASGEYNARRAQCEAAVAKLRARSVAARSLRDVTMETLEGHAAALSPVEVRRARHVVGENARTQEAATALGKGDYRRFGRLMVESHESLRSDYEVSCPELDELVEVALEVRGVFGSRMTGGGFGGCTVTLVEPGAVEALVGAIENDLTKRAGRTAEVRVVRPSAAAGAFTTP